MMNTCSDSALILEVAEIVRRAAKIPDRVPIHPESSLSDDLRIDSLDFVAVILQLQDHFEVVIEEEAVPHLCRVADLAAYLAGTEAVSSIVKLGGVSVTWRSIVHECFQHTWVGRVVDGAAGAQHPKGFPESRLTGDQNPSTSDGFACSRGLRPAGIPVVACPAPVVSGSRRTWVFCTRLRMGCSGRQPGACR